MLPPPKPLVNVGKTVALDNVVIIVGTTIEVVGGMDGRVHEITINLLEGVSMGRGVVP